MSDTITIASRLPMSLRITEPHANPDKPGEGPEPRTIVINGNATAVGSNEGLTEGVDAEVYHKWAEANPQHPALTSGSLREVKEGEKPTDASMFGHEPALEKAAKDASDAEKGSTITHEGALKSDEMAAHSDAPGDDSPRSQTAIFEGHDPLKPVPSPATLAPQPVSIPVAVPVAPAV